MTPYQMIASISCPLNKWRVLVASKERREHEMQGLDQRPALILIPSHPLHPNPSNIRMA